jgi:hypothetical protein
MELRIFDRMLRWRSVCDRVLSLTASEAFDRPGACTWTAPLDEAKRFSPERIVVLPGMEDAYVIEAVREDTAAGTVTVSAGGLLSYFGRSVIPVHRRVTGAADTLCASLIAEFGAAALPGPLDLPETGESGEADTDVGPSTLLAALRAVCGAAGCGMRLSFLPETGRFAFSLRPRARVPFFLSRTQGGLAGSERTQDLSRYANRAVVLGEGGVAVTVTAAGLFDDGWDDAAQPPRAVLERVTEFSAADYGTEALYRAALEARGRRILAGRRPVRTVSLRVSESTAADLRLGDLFPVYDDAAGLDVTALCTERTLTLRGGGTTVTVRADVVGETGNS